MNDTETREAVIRRAEDACRPCGPCDAGLPMGCTCDPEPRAVIVDLLNLIDTDAALVAARVAAARAGALREAAEQAGLNFPGATTVSGVRVRDWLETQAEDAVAVPEPEEGP